MTRQRTIGPVTTHISFFAVRASDFATRLYPVVVQNTIDGRVLILFFMAHPMPFRYSRSVFIH